VLGKKLQLPNSVFSAERAEACSVVLSRTKEDISASIKVKTALQEHSREEVLFESSKMFQIKMAHWQGVSWTSEIFGKIVSPALLQLAEGAGSNNPSMGRTLFARTDNRDFYNPLGDLWQPRVL
jgi:hypothetical protein